MKKLLLLIFGCMVALPCAQIIAQAPVIDRIYKENGIWKGDLSQPLQGYPIKGAVISDTSAIPDPPKPIPIPPTTPLTSVDNVDPTITYAGGGWYSGPTNAEGFYPALPNSTMAYSNVTANTATFIFTGTSIEVFCEKKLGHGSALFQIDNQTLVNIPLGVAGPVGSTSVFKAENLTNTQHTFKLTVAGGGYVVFDYVKINGTAVTPIPPVEPPTTGDVIVVPGQSIKHAVEMTASGKTVVIQAGTYNEPNINVPLGVSIKNSGTVVINATTPGTYFKDCPEVGLFMFNSSSSTQGNQSIEGLTLEGNNVAFGGVLVTNRNNIKIKNCIIRNFNFHGIWLRGVKDSEVTDNDLFNTSWASTGFSSGQINIYALERVNILRNKIGSNKDLKGCGIEALWKQSTMKDLKIMDNTFALDHRSPWNNYQSKNMSIEIHDTHYNGIEIAGNVFGNQMSLASHKPATAATPGKTLVHDNTGNLGGDTYFIEAVCDNMDVHNNTITGAQMFSANFQPNSVWKNHNYYNNNFTSSGAVSWGGIFLIGQYGVQNFSITNNTFKLSGNKKVTYMGVTGGVTESGNTWNP